MLRKIWAIEGEETNRLTKSEMSRQYSWERRVNEKVEASDRLFKISFTK